MSLTDRLRREKSAAELRKFGFVMTAAWGALGAIAWWRSGASAPYLWLLAAAFLAPALVWPRALAPVERVWMRFASVLSIVMTTVILTLTFFLVVTPLGLLLRMLGKDLLGIRPDRPAKSYWIPVEADGPGTRPDKPF